MEIVGSLNPKDNHIHIQMPEDYPIESEEAYAYVARAMGLADKLGKIAHIQNPDGFTVHIVYPEDRSTN